MTTQYEASHDTSKPSKERARRQRKMTASILSELGRERLGLPGRFQARRLTDATQITEARRLATEKFVALGKIVPEKVGADGLLIHDTLFELSTFFGAYDTGSEQLVMTARLLWRPDSTVEDMRLPVEAIKPEYADYLAQLVPGAVAELGSLAKSTMEVSTAAEMKLLRSIWDFAADNDIEVLVCGLEPKVYPSFRKLFGDALTELSDGTVTFPGIEGPQKPLMVNVREAARQQERTGHATRMQRITRHAVRHMIISKQTRRKLGI